MTFWVVDCLVAAAKHVKMRVYASVGHAPLAVTSATLMARSWLESRSPSITLYWWARRSIESMTHPRGERCLHPEGQVSTFYELSSSKDNPIGTET